MALPAIQRAPIYNVEGQRFWSPAWCLLLFPTGASAGAWPGHHCLPVPGAGAPLLQQWSCRRVARKREAGEPATEALLRRVAWDAGFVVGDGRCKVQQDLLLDDPALDFHSDAQMRLRNPGLPLLGVA